MNKKAIVTGGSRGIGRGIVKKLAASGYDVAFSYSTKAEEAKVLAETLAEETGVRCACFKAALNESGAWRELFKKCTDFLGGLDLLVNNAGVTIFESLSELTQEKVDYLVELDFKTYLFMMDAAARYMKEHGTKGSIINVTSSRGQRAYPGDGLYGGLKAGLNRAIESFALDMAPYGIRINNVAPGAIAVRTKEELAAQGVTDEKRLGFWDRLGGRIPLERCGTPEDIADAVCYLASDKASYVTGFTLRVDGGLILPGMPERADASNWGSPAK
ncbi:MAG: SDR family NAD(P)-dependent oxidoreductase [Oscillospiraceae bacterium]